MAFDNSLGAVARHAHTAHWQKWAHLGPAQNWASHIGNDFDKLDQLQILKCQIHFFGSQKLGKDLLHRFPPLPGHVEPQNIICH